ncbi:hypothetical protein CLOM_g4381 [Closterium sp. NIES-68]|nr:hypothetical protein CLOM_g4381 [Closterium sp. NIES-68]
MALSIAILLLCAIATADSADRSPHIDAPYHAAINSTTNRNVAHAAAVSSLSTLRDAFTNQTTHRSGVGRQRLRLSSRLAVRRDAPSTPDGKEPSPYRRSLSASDPHASASKAVLPPNPSDPHSAPQAVLPPPVPNHPSPPSISSGPSLFSLPSLASIFAFMQPRDPRQVPPTSSPPALPVPPVLPPPVLRPPIARPPPVKPPPRAPAPPPPFFQPWPINGQGIFNVLQFGARADGRTDNTDAFRRALQSACAWGKARNGYARVVVPASGLFQIFPVELEGPCGAGLEVLINGGIAGAANVTSYPKPRKSNAWGLLFFREVANLAVRGSGWMDGRGAGFWARSKGSKKPTLLFLMHCDNATVQGIGLTNSAKAHLKVYASNGLLIEGITTRSPFNSPNTDSIQVSRVENGVIRNSQLQGGDDNVAIGDGCHNLLVENLVCINGHGVSIGSLGKDRETACVSDVLVRNVTFTGSNNALRIKTYQGGKGLVSNVTYRDIRVTDVTWPIIIDQFYFLL